MTLESHCEGWVYAAGQTGRSRILACCLQEGSESLCLVGYTPPICQIRQCFGISIRETSCSQAWVRPCTSTSRSPRQRGTLNLNSTVAVRTITKKLRAQQPITSPFQYYATLVWYLRRASSPSVSPQRSGRLLHWPASAGKLPGPAKAETLHTSWVNCSTTLQPESDSFKMRAPTANRLPQHNSDRKMRKRRPDRVWLHARRRLEASLKLGD